MHFNYSHYWLIFTLLFCSFAVSGCAGLDQDQSRQIVEKRVAAECPVDAKGTAAQRHRCKRDIVIAEMPDDPGLSIFIKNTKSLIKVAEQYDAGKISRERYLQLKGDIKAEFEGETAAMNAQLMRDNRLAQQAYFQQLQIQQQNANHQQALINSLNAPKVTNCNSFGNTLHCSSY